jgi:hypothetical protein
MESAMFVPSPQQQAVYDWVEHGRGSAVVVAATRAKARLIIVEAE